MRRIFWDTMLLVYMLEGHPTFSAQVKALLKQSLQRRDLLFTSWLAIGEVLAGAERAESRSTVGEIEYTISKLPIEPIAFDSRCSAIFGKLRAQKVSVADSAHLACAAAVDTDLFLTNDKALHKLAVPGIKFIAGMDALV